MITENDDTNTIHQLKIKKFSVTDYLLADIKEEDDLDEDDEDENKDGVD